MLCGVGCVLGFWHGWQSSSDCLLGHECAVRLSSVWPWMGSSSVVPVTAVVNVLCENRHFGMCAGVLRPYLPSSTAPPTFADMNYVG